MELVTVMLDINRVVIIKFVFIHTDHHDCNW